MGVLRAPPPFGLHEGGERLKGVNFLTHPAIPPARSFS